ncbi:MAG: GDSL-type esterase/lipase family protein, partial [Flavisolibacter sp.]
NNAAGNNVLQASELRPYGRSILNDKNELALISSAVHFGFSFEGTECRVYASLPYAPSHNYLQYELDGVYQKRIRIDGDSSKPIVISAAKNGKHTVWIYKATEAHTGDILVQKISGENVKALSVPGRTLIEFIGNSITCGAAADPSEVPCGTGEYHDQHNAYYAYGPRVARDLHVNFIMSSVSGIGIYRNWNSDGPTMPQVYENTDFQLNSKKPWDFKKYTPKVVSIALGTNDFSGGDGKRPRLPFDSAVFVSNYIQFVKTVKSKYPYAQIALLSSPMMNGRSRELLQNCLTAVKKNIDATYPVDKTVALHFFKPMQARGCGGHPSVEDHAILASELVPFFKKLVE